MGRRPTGTTVLLSQKQTTEVNYAPIGLSNAPVTFPPGAGRRAPGAGRRAPGGEGVSGGHPMSRPSETNPGCLKLHLVTVTLDTGQLDFRQLSRTDNGRGP